MIEKRYQASFLHMAAECPYFAIYMNNVAATTLKDISLERYCHCGHFEYNYSPTLSFWSQIWAIKHNLAFL